MGGSGAEHLLCDFVCRVDAPQNHLLAKYLFGYWGGT